MDPIGLAGIALGVIGLFYAKKDDPVRENTEKNVLDALKDASKITVPPIDQWIEVEHGNEKYLVSPRYIAPVGIGEALRITKTLGLELPTPELVNSIWKAADLKLEPNPRGALSVPPSDFTLRTMNSPETNIAQLAYIQNQIGDKKYKLLGGTHKDVVMKNGKLGIYGWHHLTGKIIQDFYTGHAHSENPALDWKDYSQGLRLVRKVSQNG